MFDRKHIYINNKAIGGTCCVTLYTYTIPLSGVFVTILLYIVVVLVVTEDFFISLFAMAVCNR